MSRLIIKNEFGGHQMNQPRERGKSIGTKDIFRKLYEYEQTGLEPEEVAELSLAKAEGRLVVSRGKVTSARLEALNLINFERNRQDAIWGEQNHEPQYWVGILGEEFGEYCEAVNETVFDNGPEAREKGGYDNMMKELVHVAAVAVGAIEALMRTKDD